MGKNKFEHKILISYYEIRKKDRNVLTKTDKKSIFFSIYGNFPIISFIYLLFEK